MTVSGKFQITQTVDNPISGNSSIALKASLNPVGKSSIPEANEEANIPRSSHTVSELKSIPK